MNRQLLTVFLWLVNNAALANACAISDQPAPNDTAKALHTSKLNEVMQCDPADPGNDQSPCNTFAGKGLTLVYGYSDFKTATGYLDAKHIGTFVASSERWVDVGTVFDAANNACAQSLANTGRAVVAVQSTTTDLHGHIALVLPGTLTKSGTWNMPVANSASFFYEKPFKSYVNEPLSKSFSPANAAKAEFYYRKLDGEP